MTPLAPERYKLQVTLSTRDAREAAARAGACPTRGAGWRRRLDSRSRVDAAHRSSRAAQVCPCGVAAREPERQVLHRDATYRRLSGGTCGSAIRVAARSRDGQAGATRPRSSSFTTSSRTRREAQPRRTTSSSAAARTTSMRLACSSGTSSSASDRRCGAQSIGAMDEGFVARALRYHRKRRTSRAERRNDARGSISRGLRAQPDPARAARAAEWRQRLTTPSTAAR